MHRKEQAERSQEGRRRGGPGQAGLKRDPVTGAGGIMNQPMPPPQGQAKHSSGVGFLCLRAGAPGVGKPAENSHLRAGKREKMVPELGGPVMPRTEGHTGQPVRNSAHGNRQRLSAHGLSEPQRASHPHPHLLLGLDPHVLRPLLAMLAFVRAACLALGRLQPRGPWSHHLHGWHTATATLWEEK